MDLDVINKAIVKSNVLIDAVEGKGGIWEKKKMIAALIENGIDIYFENQDGKNFYELIKDSKLKKWVEETYPNIEEKLRSKKYNL
jgi:hypothetical protein